MPDNPFEVTTAKDFTDAQIADNWVDLPGGGFVSLADPRSPMPRFLVGGKGGGRTHLLRYFSYPLQRLRHQNNLLSAIRSEGYLGIYFHCGGLNSSRFAGKNQQDETWSAVFSYYMEIWLARLTMTLVAELYEDQNLPGSRGEIRCFVNDVRGLFDVDIPIDLTTDNLLRSTVESLTSLQRRLDFTINNAALRHNLDIDISVTPGRLIFGIPAAASKHLDVCSDLVFAYLIDEFENLTSGQQRYINTLIREKKLPTTFLIGSRRYGLRTHRTMSADEENKQGSEFDLVVLEEAYKSQAHKYHDFCRDIVYRRLTKSGVTVGTKERLKDYLTDPTVESGSLEMRATDLLHQHLKTSSSPWVMRLEEQLQTLLPFNDLTETIENVRFPASVLHEKFAIFLLYRAWADGKILSEEAPQIRDRVSRMIETNDRDSKTYVTYKHYRHDLYAQILQDLGLEQEYLGLDKFIEMSSYLPRNLIVILKQVTRWSLFLDERPFHGGRISERSQHSGVREASAWFLADAKGLGRSGEQTQRAIRRLGGLFKDMRYSDKPVEVSCSAFSTDRHGLTAAASASLDEAVLHSLLIELPVGRRAKNSQVWHRKYQLNPMLAPLFDLSVALRGVDDLSADILNGIFDPSVSDGEYNGLRRRMLVGLNAPFSVSSTQPSLFAEVDHGL